MNDILVARPKQPDELATRPARLRPNIIDLFAGAGGLSLGAARAGFHLALAVELDKHAVASHRKNFPGIKHSETDISQQCGEQILACAELSVGELDGMVGGPPCQGFSIMGGRDAGDPRNNLFVKFFELVSQCRPKFFVAENVLGILDDQYKAIREEAFQHIRSDYTFLEGLKLKASDFGAATSRERVFFIGYQPQYFTELTHAAFDAQKVNEITTVANALDGLPPISNNWITEEDSWKLILEAPDSWFMRKIIGEIPVGLGDPEAIRLYQEDKIVSGCFGTRHSAEVQARYGNLKPGQKDKISGSVRLKLDGLCPTLRAGTGVDKGSYQAVRPIHPTLPRVITPREAARLQGFPDWFQFSPSKWQSFRQIGNSVSPIVAEAVFKVIRRHLLPLG